MLGGATKTTSLHFTKSDLFRTISIFVFVQTGHFELIFSDRVSPSGRDFLRKRYLEGELRDGEDLPNCYDQVRQKKTQTHKNFGSGDPPPPLYIAFNGEAFTKLKGAPLTDKIPKEAFGGHPFSLDPLTSQPTEYDDSSSGMESLSGTSKIGSAAGSTPTSARLALRWSLKLYG